MKKIFSLLILISFFFTSFIQTNALVALMIEPKTEDLQAVKVDLSNMRNGERYISQIDSVIAKYENNSAILNKLSLRVIKAKSNISSSSKSISKKEKNILTILEYLDLKVKLAIYNIYKDGISKKKGQSLI